MSKDAHYTDKDAQQFAALIPQVTGKQSGGKRASNPPDIQTRPNYSDKDLEKFQKMFNAGFAPEGHEKQPNDSSAGSSLRASYSVADEEQFQRIAVGGAPRKASIEPSKGGRAAERKAAGSYNTQDLAQFESLAAQLRTPSSTSGTKTRSESRGTGPGEGSKARQWRFPDLHEASSSLASSGPRTKSFGHPSLMRPGEGRIKLRHFD